MMAVFLVNQCTFAKLPNVAPNEQQASPATIGQNGSNGPQTPTSQQQQPNMMSTNSFGMSHSTSNICGLKFDRLLDLIHHIEENHINDYEYQSITSIHPAYYNGQSQSHVIQPLTPHSQQIPHPHSVTPQPTPTQTPTSHHVHTQQLQQQPPPTPSPHVMHPHSHAIQQVVTHQHAHPHPQSTPHHVQHHHVTHYPQQHVSQPLYSDNQRMQNIIGGQWLPTSCILRIFSSTQKPPQMKKELVIGDSSIGSPATPLYHQHPQTPTPQPATPHQHHQPILAGPSPQGPPMPMQHPPQQMTPQPQTPHQLSVDMVAPSPQMCTSAPMDTNNSHQIILASPKIIGNMYHGSPYHVSSGPITTTQQLNMTAVTLAGPAVSQPMTNGSQLVNVSNSIQAQTIQLQPQQQPQSQQTIQLQPPQMLQHPHSHQLQQQAPNMISQPGTPQAVSQPQLMAQTHIQMQMQSQMQQMHPQMPQQIQQQLQPQMQSGQVQMQAQSQLQTQMQPAPMGPTQMIQQIQPSQMQSQTQVQIAQPQQQMQLSRPVAAKTNTDKIKCPECGRQYKTQKNFNIHVANSHKKDASDSNSANNTVTTAASTPTSVTTATTTITTTSNTTVNATAEAENTTT